MEKAQNREVNSVGSSRIRGRWLWRNWDNCDEYHVGDDCDVIIFQKAYWDVMIEHHDGIKIFDICDPDWLENRDVFSTLVLCDAITTSTEALAKYIRKLLPNKLVRHIPDRIDLDIHSPIKNKHNDKLEHVVWFGYSHNFHYLAGTFKKLIQYGIKIDVYADTSFGGQYKDLKLKYYPYQYPQIHKALLKYDAALLPVRRLDEKGKYKSANKNVTCWALGLPVVAYGYDLDKLQSQEAREKEAEKKLALVKKEWDIKQSVKEFEDLILEIDRSKRGKKK